MSFGFGVGDFLAAFALATKLRGRWVDAPIEYKSIRDETKNLENILRDIGELGQRTDLDPKQESTLSQVSVSCREIVEECMTFVDKHSSVQTNKNGRFKVRRVWSRLKIDPDDIRHLRDRMASQVVQLSALQGVIEANLLIDVDEGVQDLQHSNTQRERASVADWYSSADFAIQQTDQLSRRTTGTGSWFLARAEYKHWYCQINSTLLCHGIPGSGKSVMAATIIDDLRTRFGTNKDIVLAYFYCNFNRREEQDPSRVLATLVRQLFQEQARLPESVKMLYEKHRDIATRPSTNELRTLLHSLLSLYHQVFLVVDALDEYDNSGQQRDRFLDELLSLQKQPSRNVNILATTRSIPEVVCKFMAAPRIEIRADKGDIGVYLADRMLGLAPFVTRSFQLQEEIRRQITEAADGMFLLARFQFDSLRDKTNPGQMRDALARLEKGSNALDGEYMKVLNRIELQLPGWRELARRVLMWITYARRQLSISELREAVAINTINATQPGRRDISLSDYLDDKDQIVSVCHGLVEVDEECQVFRLVHKTTQDYFARVRDRWLHNGDLEITRSCLAYLSMNIFTQDRCPWGSDLSKMIEQHSFLKYAGKNWGLHARMIRDERLETEIIEFLKDDRCQRFVSQITFRAKKPLRPGYSCKLSDISAVHISIYFNLPHILQQLVEQGQDVNCQDSNRQAPLFWAAWRGHSDMVQLLLAYPDIEVNAYDRTGNTALMQAAMFGHFETVRLLLARLDIEVNLKDISGDTALVQAARWGNIETVQLLLAHSDIEVNTYDGTGNTALMQAAMFDHFEIVRLLLAHSNIKVNLKNGLGNSALTTAAERGFVETVKLLLAHPDIEHTPEMEISESLAGTMKLMTNSTTKIV